MKLPKITGGSLVDYYVHDVYYNVLQHFVSGLPLYMDLGSASNPMVGPEASCIMKDLYKLFVSTIRFFG